MLFLVLFANGRSPIIHDQSLSRENTSCFAIIDADVLLKRVMGIEPNSGISDMALAGSSVSKKDIFGTRVV